MSRKKNNGKKEVVSTKGTKFLKEDVTKRNKERTRATEIRRTRKKMLKLLEKGIIKKNDKRHEALERYLSDLASVNSSI